MMEKRKAFSITATIEADSVTETSGGQLHFFRDGRCCLKLAQGKLVKPAKGRQSLPPEEIASWKAWWNELAQEQGLSAIRSLDYDRAKILCRRIKEHGDYRDKMAEQIRNRSVWAQGQSFFTFDWCSKRSPCRNILEGNYRDKATGDDRKLVAMRQRDEEGRAYRASQDAKAGEKPNLSEALEKLKRRRHADI